MNDGRDASSLAIERDAASLERIAWLDDGAWIVEEWPAARWDAWEDWALFERLSQSWRLLFGP